MGSPRLREGHRGHMGVTWGHIGVTGVTGVTWGSRCSNGSETGSHGVTGVTWGSLGSHWGHGGHMGVTWGHEGHRGDRPRPLTPDPAGGAVLLVESVLSPGGAGPTRTLLLSLTMLLQARGRERTEAEYRALTARAGFSRLRLRRPRGPYHAMMAARGGGAGARSDGGGGDATSQTGSGTGSEVGAQD
jgi:hypothetical protein